MTSNATYNISVFGLGKLGSPLAAVLAGAGHHVIGVDKNERFVAAINDAKAPVEEPGLPEAVAANAHNLRATLDYEEAVLSSDVSFIIVPTPSLADHTFDNSFLIAALEDIGAALKQKSGYHLVSIVSTVMPGSTDGVLKEALEKTSGRQVGSDELGLCYNPEFIALGNVINSMRKPDFLLVGESDRKAGDFLSEVRLSSCVPGTPVRRMNFINAEITKIAINTYVTTKISYANMLAELCEQTPHADVDTVTNTVGSDSRIGTKYLKGAVGYGGPCFPRDNKAFAAFGAERDVSCTLAEATDTVNNRQIDRIVNRLQDHVQNGAKVCVLGLAYKDGTSEVDESQGVLVCKALEREGYHVSAHDPLATSTAKHQLQDSDVDITDDLKQALESCSAALIMLPLAAYSDVPHIMEEVGRDGAVLIDPWRFMQHEDTEKVRVIPMGKHKVS